ncbi:cytosolic protein [Virgibacillus doumboii]|uniref:cytosolic protein n=1 Tax=Virgibacillus doumboii TaxID=2697503 RepID=UPI0013E0D998|nr:cytosolic protein [Virgibacillus doumboii]
MSFRQTIAKYFGNHAETNEKHIDPSLRTHYYKTTKDKGLAMLENLFQYDDRYEIIAFSKEHGELSANIVKGKKAFIVGTVIMVGPYKTAIDFSVTTESAFPFDFGYSTKVIHQLYGKANNELTRIESVS